MVCARARARWRDARPLSVLRQRRSRSTWPPPTSGARRHEPVKRALGLDTCADRYTYAARPLMGHTAARKIPETVGQDDLRLLLGRLRDVHRRQGRTRHQRARQCRSSRQRRHALSERALGARHARCRNRASTRYPLLKRGHGVERVGWDEAIQTMADRFRAVQQAHGPAGASASSAPASWSPKSSTRSASSSSSASARPTTTATRRSACRRAVAGYKRSFGSDGPPGRYEDLEWPTSSS